MALCSFPLKEEENHFLHEASDVVVVLMVFSESFEDELNLLIHGLCGWRKMHVLRNLCDVKTQLHKTS